MWNNFRNFIKDKMFLIAIIITAIFLLSPLWLNCEILYSFVSCFLSVLKDQGFKSSYIETCGAILGTFLAITGALWTQREIDRKKELLEIKQAATVIYFDFKFAFDDIFTFERSYACVPPEIKNQYNDIEIFNKYRRGIKLYIDSDWIHNVAKLCGIMTNEQIKQIYNIYGTLETIKASFEKKDEEVDERLAHYIYNVIYAELFDLTSPPIKISEKEINKKLMKSLKKLTE